MTDNVNDDFISEDSFMDDYRPIQYGKDGDYVYPLVQDAKADLEKRGLSEAHFWTVIEGDDDGSLYASPGLHVVNAIGYILTEEPARSDVVDAVWYDASEDLDELDDLEPLPGM